MNAKYSDEFKMKVVQDYYSSPLGLRTIALKYNLLSKNYIINWEKYLIKKGLIPPGSTKPNKTVRSLKSRYSPVFCFFILVDCTVRDCTLE